MTEGPEHRVGDILRVTCPWTPAKVARVAGGHAFIVWPWAEEEGQGFVIDPHSTEPLTVELVSRADP